MTSTVDLTRLELTVGPAARVLRCSPSLLRKLEQAGAIQPARRDDTGRRVYDLRDIEEIQRARAQRAAGGLANAPVAAGAA